MTAIESFFFTFNSIEILFNVNTYSRAHMPIYCVLIHYILIQKNLIFRIIGHSVLSNNNSLLKMRHEAKTAYSQNTVQRLKTYNKIKLQGVHKYVIYNDNYKHIKTK